MIPSVWSQIHTLSLYICIFQCCRLSQYLDRFHLYARYFYRKRYKARFDSLLSVRIKYLRYYKVLGLLFYIYKQLGSQSYFICIFSIFNSTMALEVKAYNLSCSTHISCISCNTSGVGEISGI